MKKSREILVNLDRLNQKLDEHGLAAVVARAGVNYTYLSGVSYPGTLARHLDLTDSPRGTFVVWPRRENRELCSAPSLKALHAATPG
jgi:Xaa-Pro aminopeptidase